MNLITSYPDWYDNTKGGIFKDLYASFSTQYTWLSHYDELDTEYYGNHSGLKETSPLIDKFIAQNIAGSVTNPLVLTSAQRTKLAAIIANKYADNWARLWALTQLTYNPIENYSSTETQTPNISLKHKASDDYKVKTTSEAGADVYGFNSSTAVPSSDSDGESTQTQEGYTEDTETGTRTITKSGNIGVTTTQQMMQSSLDIYTVWNFYNDIFSDIDKILTSDIYK